MENLRQLMICEAKRIIEILEDEKTFKERSWNNDIPELCNKMKEFRRDSMRLDKKFHGRED